MVITTPIYAYIATDKWSENVEKISFIDFVKNLKANFVAEKPTVDFDTAVNRINDYVTDFTSNSKPFLKLLVN